MANYNTKTSYETRLNDLVTKRDQLNERIKRMEDIKAIYETLPFKEGDAAFHPELGNVIIRNIQYGSREDDFEDIKYVVVDIKAHCSTKSYKEFMPITETTKLLYAKK